MKVWKLVSGILSIIWSGWVMLGAGVTGFLSDMEGSKDDGTAVVVVGFFCVNTYGRRWNCFNRS